MVDNGDKSYSYSTTVARPGDITINVLKYTKGGAYTEYYLNQAGTGTHAYQDISREIDFRWNSGTIIYGKSDDVGIKFYFRLLAPASGTYYFYLTSDDITHLYIEGYLLYTVN